MDDTRRHISSLSCTTTRAPQDQELILVSRRNIDTSKEADVDQVNFDEGDPRDPKNFSYAHKWAITLTCCAFSGITGDIDVW